MAVTIVTKNNKGPIVDPALCRCCRSIKKCRLLSSEYEWMGNKEVYSDMIMDCFGLLLSHLDGDNKDCCICATCVSRLREACAFRHQVLQSEEVFLKAKLEENKDDGESKIVVEVKTEPMDADSDMNMDCEEDELSAEQNDLKPLINLSGLEEEAQPVQKVARRRSLRTKHVTEGSVKREVMTRMRGLRLKMDRMLDLPDMPQKKKTLSMRTKKPTDDHEHMAYTNTVTIVHNSYVCPFHNRVSNYYCYYCKDQFTNPNELREHTLTHDPKEMFESMMENKKLPKIDITRIDCRLCKEKIDNLETLKEHLTNIHGKVFHPIANEFLKFRLSLTNLTCTECNSSFPYFDMLKKHMVDHFGTYICDMCGACFLEQNSLRTHIKTHSKVEASFPCEICGKNLKSKYSRYLHVATVHEKKPTVNCYKCEASFLSYALRNRHLIEVHGDKRTFPCKLCDKVYNRRKTLMEHNRRNHLKVYRHQCDLCDQRFYLPSRLKEHMATHTGERNFRCEFCDKSYPRLQSLQEHLRSHSSDRRYKCDVCNSTFTQNGSLKNHLKSHHQGYDVEAKSSDHTYLKMSVNNKKGPIIDPGMCRCCGSLKKCRLLNVEYEWQGQKEIYSDMFVDCFGLLLSHLEGSPTERLICATCVSRLREATAFRQQVLRCEERLLTAKIHLHNDDSETKDEILFEACVKDEKVINNDLLEDDHHADDITNDLEEATELSPRRTRSSVKNKKPARTKRKLKSNVEVDLMTQIQCMQDKMKKLEDEDIPQMQKETTRKNIDNETKAYRNTIAIVENSYVCPFDTSFSDYYCIYCRQQFTDPQKLREHTLSHDQLTYKELPHKKTVQIDITKIDCRLCPQRIDDIDEFKNHIAGVHNKFFYQDISNEFLKFRLTSGRLSCTECNSSFTFFHALKKHMAEHFGTCICDVCGAHYFQERMLLLHQKTHQRVDENYPCKECGKMFKSKHNRYLHIARTHKKEPAYPCAKCDEVLFSYTLRYRHMIDVHGDERQFQCEECDRTYDSRKSLREHNRRFHLKIFKHQCDLCDKRFYLPSRLREHMASHSGERNFRCEYCGKSYPRLRGLKVHMQSHTSEKKFKCNLCNASFTQNVNLKNHMKRQHQSLELEEVYHE
ncbi:gastrula zinc finger protein xFG20-1-like [Battus philenor]|uniref:gastrula zinc finger protein xFG20-1-like n=1 Tax=Battus philenor TaxID=42288 RepID=UPI0035CEC7D7